VCIDADIMLLYCCLLHTLLCQLWNLIGHSEPATASVTTQAKPVSKYDIWPNMPSLFTSSSSRAKAGVVDVTATLNDQSSTSVFGVIASGT
jgi:hypothetical protein